MAILSNNANVSDEIRTAGLGFGDLMLRTGQAVAETQNRLSVTGASSATALATTLVDVVAVQEKVYDDQGNITEMRTHTRRLPLVNFIDPVFYQWENVRVQAQFTGSEFADASSASGSSYSSSSGEAQGGLLIILGGGGMTVDSRSSSYNQATDSSRDISMGQVRTNALLKPRTDIGVPKPTQVLRGPHLAILQGAITDVHSGGGGSGPLTARTMSLLLQYNRRQGTPIANKAISVETDGVSWSYVGSGLTNASGQLEITLRREFIDEDADITPRNFVISARIGMVQNSTTVVF